MYRLQKALAECEEALNCLMEHDDYLRDGQASEISHALDHLAYTVEDIRLCNLQNPKEDDNNFLEQVRDVANELFPRNNNEA